MSPHISGHAYPVSHFISCVWRLSSHLPSLHPSLLPLSLCKHTHWFERREDTGRRAETEERHSGAQPPQHTRSAHLTSSLSHTQTRIRSSPSFCVRIYTSVGIYQRKSERFAGVNTPRSRKDPTACIVALSQVACSRETADTVELLLSPKEVKKKRKKRKTAV